MIPGTYFARWLILRTPLHVHVIAMEVIVVLGACSRSCGAPSPAAPAALPGTGPAGCLRGARA